MNFDFRVSFHDLNTYDRAVRFCTSLTGRFNKSRLPICPCCAVTGDIFVLYYIVNVDFEFLLILYIILNGYSTPFGKLSIRFLII